MLSVLAVLALITNSNFIDCCTDSSAGFSPEDPIRIAGGAAELVEEIRPIGDQAARSRLTMQEKHARATLGLDRGWVAEKNDLKFGLGQSGLRCSVREFGRQTVAAAP